ncbi:hypothetical protein KW417_06920 [Vibrio fluvialis]|nr:hypothetical protein [Vibrio fluvialis]
MIRTLSVVAGNQGWGGPLLIPIISGKKILYVTGGTKPKVVDYISQLVKLKLRVLKLKLNTSWQTNTTDSVCNCFQ